MVTLLSSFDFSKAPHPERKGEYLEPDLEFENSIAVRYVTLELTSRGAFTQNARVANSSPKPFECIIKPRSGALDLIHHTLEK